MKTRILITLLAFVSYTNAQDFNLTELKAPSSPGFTILGVQPTEISRPTTFNAFKASLFNNFIDNNGITIPQNLALEFTPYWLVSHKNITYDKLLETKKIGANILQSSSISIATIDIEDESTSLSLGTRMGIGYRTIIFKGQPSIENKKKLSEAVIELEESQKKVLSLVVIQTLALDKRITDFNTFKAAIPAEMDKFYKSVNFSPMLESKITKKIIDELEKENKKTSLDTKEKIKKFVNDDKLIAKVMNYFEDEIEKKAKNIQALIENNGSKNKGFFLEFAASLALDFNESEFNNSNVSKWGFWLTPSYRTASENFEFLGVLRYLRDETNVMLNSDNLDLGLKVVYEKDKFSFSGEWIQRFQDTKKLATGLSDSNSDLKAVLNIDYKLTDTILLTYTFGENFNANMINTGNLISTLGISYEIGKNTKKFKLF